jgi:pyridoxine 4-dehydrogenase
MNSETITAASAGTWQLGDLTVNRIGFGAMRLTKNADGTPSDRDQAITVLRRAIELGVEPHRHRRVLLLAAALRQ